MPELKRRGPRPRAAPPVSLHGEEKSGLMVGLILEALTLSPFALKAIKVAAFRLGILGTAAHGYS